MNTFIRLASPTGRAWAVAAVLAAAGCGHKSAGPSNTDGAAGSSTGTAGSSAGAAGSSAGAAGSSAAGATGTMDAPVAMEAAPADKPPAERPTFPDGGVCPTAPFDDSDQSVVDACTVPIAVAVGNGLRRSSTHDGITWDHDVFTPKGTGDQNEWSHRDVIMARGLIVIAGDSGVLVSSDGGETYNMTHAGTFHDAGIAYFQGAIWIVSNVGTMSTTDGTTWKEWLGTTMLPGNLPGQYSANGGVSVGGGKIFAVNTRDNTTRLFDGTTWTQQTLGASFGSLSTSTAGGGKFLIVGGACCDTTMYSGLRATSPDGVTWTVLTNASPGSASLRFMDALWTGTDFFATATQYDKRTFTSADGLTWAVKTSNQAIGHAAQMSGAYVGNADAFIYRSTDGAAWTMVHTGIGDTKWGYTRIRSGRVLR
ncbi:MAG TPA: hypothetical protein VHL80_19045 [Polyangia bacterium]|nr:hypothetical protein [Polyangia bacterium]